MSILTRRRLGRTGLQVSEISLGTVELGLDYGIRPTGEDARPGEAEAARLLHHALDLGINYLDTARAYGASEAVIGRALKGRRAEFILASKAPTFEQEGLAGAALVERVIASGQESLRELKADAIDVLMIHGSPRTRIARDEFLEALSGLRAKGVIRFAGASVYGCQSALEAIACGGYDCLQLAYSALDRRVEEQVLAAAERADVGIVARSVLLKGALTHRAAYLPEALADLSRCAVELGALAAARGLSLPELAYRYVLADRRVHTALVGTVHASELEEAVAYASRGPLSPELVSAVRAVSVADETLLSPANWPA